MALACSFTSPIAHNLSSTSKVNVCKLRVSLSKRALYSNRRLSLRTQIRAVNGNNAVSDEEKESPVINGVSTLQLSGNGSTLTSSNGSSSYAANKSVVERNLNGNGNGNVRVSEIVASNGRSGEYAAVEVVEEISSSNTVAKTILMVEVEERKAKKSVEEIGQEEAWFKKGARDKVEVSVQPGGRWSRFKTYSTIQRTLEIWGFVVKFAFRAWLNNQKFSYRGGMTEAKKVLRRKALAKWLKENILRLGPTFIKIGQQFSTRVDILAQEYVDQLSELQDQVPPFPSDVAVSIVEEELGGTVADIFERFDKEPIAAASLGQVHRARMKGRDIVVKVQRPGLKALFDIDLKNLRVIAEYLQKVDPKSDGAKRDWVAIYDECANVLYQEIDYTKEAANAELFANNFRNMDYVKVPRIYWEYTTPQVLTMEYVPGIKINRIKQLDELGVDRKRLSRYAVESYLEQILSHGFFHADPHPGNIAVDDVNGGRLIFYDFGMMGSISPNIREGLLETFYGVYEKDPDKATIL
ncbi:hypothetical protein V2J09_002026 [Rumex salicifolius]